LASGNKQLFEGGKTMLVLSRKVGEQIRIGSDVCVTVVSIKGNRITLGVDAPRDVRIDRSELAAKIASERTSVSAAAVSERLPLDSLAASVAS
jgi:carbon storage regulator CsrA